ncbi:mannitol dehydrogenase family protein [Rhizobium sp. ARZ01]|uniref:mannitol dehydrogenase family protein n=1 Tax=Rhizobium sp. ARZ01 TaxID=2769313 RepID=UPI001781F6FC|nr:mannitol dehydrogenase family protein [Rhizobium sp. ARZ01]MBD9371933.1 mannitol dehydrogenase family protein [Rhizobium sp. ARZ01]
MKTPVIQFGTSRFLQAHADLFLSEGTPAMTITVVQTSGDPARAGRLAALAAPEGYPVRVRGLQDGRVIDEERRVTSVKRCLSMAGQYDEVLRVFVEEADYVLSNTGDSGYEAKPEDTQSAFSPAMSFPAKLYHLLTARHAAGAPPLTILPMELIADNGKVLRGLVLAIAKANGASPDLTRSIADETVWASSLVDRIVSAPIEPAGAVAEPYALWAIERTPGLVAPTDHPSIQVVDDLKAIETLKLHILNLGHSALVDMWMTRGAPAEAIVREFIALPEVGAELAQIYRNEVLPAFGALGGGEEAAAYLAGTVERFANPFLDHRISDIAQNHAQKVERRIAAFIQLARDAGYEGDFPMLSAVIRRAAVR